MQDRRCVPSPVRFAHGDKLEITGTFLERLSVPLIGSFPTSSRGSRGSRGSTNAANIFRCNAEVELLLGKAFVVEDIKSRAGAGFYVLLATSRTSEWQRLQCQFGNTHTAQTTRSETWKASLRPRIICCQSPRSKISLPSPGRPPSSPAAACRSGRGGEDPAKAIEDVNSGRSKRRVNRN